MTTFDLTRSPRWLAPLNTRHHRAALNVFMVVVIAHWAEHIAQAVQIYVLGWKVPDARGLLGLPFPWLIKSEWLHYGYALIMLVVLWALRYGFAGRSRQWWNLALGIQFWHHIEHFLLLIQAQSGWRLTGGGAPSSIIQLFVPRVELHLFYNTIVTIPMIVAMVLHRRASAVEQALTDCSCGVKPTPVTV
ncbi:hypothetical protein [Amycolatopsis sp. H20-H5]|uniref:hypothetical protein n=1 Tax=Amycolatopsis sp. H20-H5 TaxID=3046309 RepID=UPI002DB863C8|nr:hypothetical protein [Amycolatopsis sp. H20-H5]MEC3981493.1 hypothetical protein [Amycolatopsis sp. H20-H5]